MNRRDLLASSAVVGLAPVAGCLTGLVDDEPSGEVVLDPPEESTQGEPSYPTYGEPFPRFEPSDPLRNVRRRRQYRRGVSRWLYLDSERSLRCSSTGRSSSHWVSRRERNSTVFWGLPSCCLATFRSNMDSQRSVSASHRFRFHTISHFVNRSSGGWSDYG